MAFIAAEQEPLEEERPAFHRGLQPGHVVCHQARSGRRRAPGSSLGAPHRCTFAFGENESYMATDGVRVKTYPTGKTFVLRMSQAGEGQLPHDNIGPSGRAVIGRGSSSKLTGARRRARRCRISSRGSSVCSAFRRSRSMIARVDHWGAICVSSKPRSRTGSSTQIVCGGAPASCAPIEKARRVGRIYVMGLWLLLRRINMDLQ